MINQLKAFYNRDVKSVNPQQLQSLNRSLLRFLGSGQAVMIDDNKEAYVQYGYLRNPAVYSVNNFMANSAASIPWILSEIKDEGAAKEYRAAQIETKSRNPFKYKALHKKAFEPIDKHPILEILKKPNPNTSGMEWEKGLYIMKNITGEYFIYGLSPENGPNKGKMLEFHTLPSHLMEIIFGDYMNPVRGYVLKYQQDIELPAENVIHGKHFNPDYSTNGSHLRGMSPLQAARSVVTASNDAYTANMKLLQNLGAIGILANEEGDYSEEQAEKLQQKYQMKYGGSHNYGKIIMASGKWAWIQTALKPDDLSISTSKIDNLRDICNVYGLNSAIFNDPENKTYNNMREARKSAYLDTIIPMKETLRDDLQLKWLPAFEKTDGKKYHLELDYDSVPELQDDLNKLRDTAKDIWYLTPRQRLTIMGLDDSAEDPALDQYYVPMGIMPLSAIGTDTSTEEAQKMLGKLGINEYE